MPTYKFASNVPATVDVKYIDIVPSEKGGPQIRFKGTIDGVEKMFAYLPGKLIDQIAALTAAGIIANQEYPTEAAELVEVKPLKRQFTMVKAQLAGEKFGMFKVVGNGNGTHPAPATPVAGATSAPVKSYTELYGKATDYILTTIVPRYKTAKLEITAADVRAMVGDLFTAKLRET